MFGYYDIYIIYVKSPSVAGIVVGKLGAVEAVRDAATFFTEWGGVATKRGVPRVVDPEAVGDGNQIWAEHARDIIGGAWDREPANGEVELDG